MISLTGGLAGCGPSGTGGSYMRLIYAPFYLMPNWSGFIYTKAQWVGGHSHAYERAEEKVSTKYLKEYSFEVIIDGKVIKKKFKVNYPLPQCKVINITMRGLDNK